MDARFQILSEKYQNKPAELKKVSKNRSENLAHLEKKTRFYFL